MVATMPVIRLDSSSDKMKGRFKQNTAFVLYSSIRLRIAALSQDEQTLTRNLSEERHVFLVTFSD